MKGQLLGGCLNFYDDPTHVNQPVDEISLITLFESHHCLLFLLEFVGLLKGFLSNLLRGVVF